MANDPNVGRSKAGLLALAKQLGNVAEACKQMGFSRDSFYRFQELYKNGGEESLVGDARRKPIPSNRVDPQVEATIIDLASKQPTWGQARVANELKGRGLTVSARGVYGVWRRHDLETIEKRLRVGPTKSSVQTLQDVRPQGALDTALQGNGVAGHFKDDHLDTIAKPQPRIANMRIDGSRMQWKTILNAGAVLTLGVFAALWLANLTIIWNPEARGEFGFTTSSNGYEITTVKPDSGAQKAGLKLGDRILAPSTLADSILFGWVLTGPNHPIPGQRLSFSIIRAEQKHPVSVDALPAARLSPINMLALVTLCVETLLCAALGLFLALVRPSRMVWGFCLVAVAAPITWMPYYPFSGLPPRWMFALSDATAALQVSAAFGFLMFCLRFPCETPGGWRKALDTIAPFALVAFASLTVWMNIDALNPANADRDQAVTEAIVGGTILTLFLGSLSLVLNYLSARGPDRHRISWVVLGTVCAFVASVGFGLGFLGVYNNMPAWWSEIWTNVPLSTLFTALPVAVAYAVMRHRVIDARFVISRTLVFGTLAIIAGTFLVLLDWFFSNRLINSRSQIAVYAGIALVIGLLLNSARQRMGTIIDRLFFRQWHRTEVQSKALDDLIHRAFAKTDLYELLTTGIANAYSIASVALFEKLLDGGLVRVAAQGWPSGTLWHLLPEDPVAKRAGLLKPTNLDSLVWTEGALPAGVARPSLMIPLVSGKQVSAVLLCGAHENGTALDPDEIRSIRRLCADAGLVYGQTASGKSAPLLAPGTLRG